MIGEACSLITRSTLTVRRNILDRFDKNIQVSIDDKKIILFQSQTINDDFQCLLEKLSKKKKKKKRNL